jgi:periplasmic protein CpxP/Spy
MRTLLIFAVLLTAAPSGLIAQPAQDPVRRQQIERTLRQRFAQVIQRELQLDDSTMRRFGATVQKFDEPRRDLMRRENIARRQLRDELSGSGTPDQQKVSELLDDMLAAQKQRVALHEQEDRELRAFLTPVQRAKYYGLQEQLRRRAEEMQMQRNRPRGRPGGPPGAMPPDR